MLARRRAFVRFRSGDSSAEDGYAEDGYAEDGYAEDGYAEDGYADEPGFWNRIPGRQYTGPHADAGGVTRQEQEEAIAPVAERVAELANQNDS